jgi:hypothetical protein
MNYLISLLVLERLYSAFDVVHVCVCVILELK